MVPTQQGLSREIDEMVQIRQWAQSEPLMDVKRFYFRYEMR